MKISILAILKKDLREIISSVPMTFLVVMPIFMAFIFSLFMEMGNQYKIGTISPEDREVIAQLKQQFTEIEFLEMNDEASMLEAIKQNKVDTGLVISGNIDSTIEVRMFVEDGRQETAALLHPLLNRFFSAYQQIQYPDLVQIEYIDSGRAEGFLGASIWILLGILTIGLTLISGYFAEERENQTWSALIVLPISRLELVAGKIGVGVVTSLFMAFALVIVNNISIADYLLFALVVFLGAVIFSAIGFFLGGITRNQTSATAAGTLLLLFFLLIPLLVDIKYLNVLALISPSYYLVQGLDASLGLFYESNSLVSLLVLSGWAIGALAIVIPFLKSERIGESEGI